MKVLVVYFSATNTTEGIVKNLAEGLGADIYEIIPEEPYTAADLNYNDNNSRTMAEMNDSDARPAITGSAEDMTLYDVISLGYPIWWGDMPMPVCTFIESYDFSGKTVIPFCTHAGSGLSRTVQMLKDMLSGATVLDGLAITGTTAQNNQSEAKQSVLEWLDKLGIQKL